MTAILYSSVGHGGASGYLAAMALFSMAALTLNILIAAIALIKYKKAAIFPRKYSGPLLFPLCLLRI